MRLFSILCLGLLLAGTFTAGVVLNTEHNREEGLLRAALSEGVEHQLDGALQSSTETISGFVKDFGGWDLVGDFVSRPDKSWGDSNIGAVANKKGVDFVWLYNENLDVAYAYSVDQAAALAEVPIDKAGLKKVIAKNLPTSFFVENAGKVVEIYVGRIEPSASGGRANKPFGYIFAARQWSSVLLKELSKKTNTEISISSSDWDAVPDTMSAVTFFKPLSGWDGAPVATLKATRGAEAMATFVRIRQKMVMVAQAYGAGVLLVALLLAWQILRRPRIETASAGGLANS